MDKKTEIAAGRKRPSPRTYVCVCTIAKTHRIDCIRLAVVTLCISQPVCIQPQNKLKARSDSIILRVYLKQTYFGHFVCFLFIGLIVGNVCDSIESHSFSVTVVCVLFTRCIFNLFSMIFIQDFFLLLLNSQYICLLSWSTKLN